MEKVQDIHITKNTTLAQLNAQFDASSAFTAKKLADGTAILAAMQNVDVKFLSFPAALISTGIRGLVRDLAKSKMFDIIMTTCGTLDHDITRSVASYHHGRFEADDAELAQKEIHRLGNVFIPFKNYGEAIETTLQPMLQAMYDEGKRELGTAELNREIGVRLNNDDSILTQCARNNIQVIVPGITDGAVGTQILVFQQEHPDFRVDVFRDEQILMDMLFGEEKTMGALMIGGGISKHHTIWWAQFASGLDYAVFVTTAVEHDGSLSGARTREAISWNKMKQEAKHITIEGDATIILPLLVGPLLG